MPRRILITGSRDWPSPWMIRLALLDVWWYHWGGPPDTVLVHGAARGADTQAAEIWTGAGLREERHPADWANHGKRAGPIRNQKMVDLGADICLAFPMPDSIGTRHCMSIATAAGIELAVFDPFTFGTPVDL